MSLVVTPSRSGGKIPEHIGLFYCYYYYLLQLLSLSWVLRGVIHDVLLVLLDHAMVRVHRVQGAEMASPIIC